jgi:uroporphyrinogen decarboxylase
LNSRERVRAAIHYQSPDLIPIRHAAMAAALHQHGERLFDLWEKYPGDFGPPQRMPIPAPDPADFRPDGSYYSTARDKWGVLWEYRIFGIMGHPLERPLDDWSRLRDWRPPQPPRCGGAALEERKQQVRRHQESYYCLGGGGNIFEVMIAVRRFEDVLMDIVDDTAEINALADMITDYLEACVRFELAAGVDGIAFGDDFGTETSLLISPAVWRRFFRPRYERLMAPVRAAGADIFFHSCGQIIDLLDDFAELGVDVFWPQLTVNDNELLAKKLREHRMTLLAHLDRRGIMPFGTPAQVREEVARIVRLFGRREGGLIFYGEIDHDFPFANIEALFQAFYEMRDSLEQ